MLNCYAPIPSDLTRELAGCRIIARYGIGLDTIDVPAATEAGIVVTNVPDYCIDEVSDHALALILALARGVVRLDRRVHMGSWSPMDAAPLHRIRGRTLGLVGFGRIARTLATKAAAVGFRVVASDPFLADDDIAAAGAEPITFDRLLAGADVISLHAPLTEDDPSPDRSGRALGDVRRCGDREHVAWGAGRPRCAARCPRLRHDRRGRPRRARAEPPAPDDPLLARPDVIVTPHAAFYSEESMIELQRKAVQQVIEVLAGRVPPYAVNARELGLTPG